MVIISPLAATRSLDIPPSEVKDHHQTKNDPDPCIPHLQDNKPPDEKEYEPKKDISKEVLVPHCFVP